jgi:spore coat protein U-like protein
MKLTKLFLLLASASALVISYEGAVLAAGSAHTDLSVTTNVIKSCTIGTSVVNFTDYDPTAAAANDTGVGTVTITCTKGTSPTVSLGSGAHASGNQRNMKEVTPGTALISYLLFQDSARTVAWGDGTNGGSPFTPTPVTTVDNSPQTYSVYGRITPLQNVPMDTYSDTVTATVNF